MANHKSAAKRARQTVKKNAVNKNRKVVVRSAEKKLRAAVASNDKDLAEKTFKIFESKIDKATKNGTIHKNTASRKVSRLSLLLNTLNA